MKQRRLPILLILLCIVAFSIPLLTQTSLLPGASGLFITVKNVFSRINGIQLDAPGGLRQMVQSGNVDGRLMLFHVVIPSVAVFGIVFFWMRHQRLKKQGRQWEKLAQEKSRAAADLAQRMAGIDRLLNFSPVAAYRFVYKNGWEVEFFSDGILVITGYPSSYFSSLSVQKYMDLIHPEDRERVGDAFEKTFRKQPAPNLEYRMIDKEGRTKWVCEKVMASEKSFSETGEDRIPETVEGILMDITTQKEDGQAFLKQQGMLDSLMESLPGLIFYKDRKGIYLACNHAFAALAGKTPGEVAGSTDYDLFDAKTADILRENDLNMLARMKQRKNNERILLKDGTRVLYETIRVPLFLKDGKAHGLLGISRDITSKLRK